MSCERAVCSTAIVLFTGRLRFGIFKVKQLLSPKYRRQASLTSHNSWCSCEYSTGVSYNHFIIRTTNYSVGWHNDMHLKSQWRACHYYLSLRVLPHILESPCKQRSEALIPGLRGKHTSGRAPLACRLNMTAQAQAQAQVHTGLV